MMEVSAAMRVEMGLEVMLLDLSLISPSFLTMDVVVWREAYTPIFADSVVLLARWTAPIHL